MTNYAVLRDEVRLVYISKHAVRRYLERAKGLSVPISDDGEALWALQQAGVDVAEAQAEIERIAGPAVTAGAASIKHGNLRYLIRGSCAVSVVPVHGVWNGGF